MLPLLAQRFVEPPAGWTFLGVSYLPKDFLQYAAFSRQVAADGAFFFYNPFTTEPQAGRFVLLFHWGVGLVARVSGAPVLEVLEWSRVPLLFVFFGVLWWFLAAIFPERRDRAMATLLVGFAGGLEGWVRPLAGALPPALELRLRQDTWPLHGWSTFASFYNPLWIAALTLALAVLRPLLLRRERSLGVLALASAGFVALFFVHPYTALGVAAIVAVQPAAAWLCGEPLDWRRTLADAAALGAGLVVIGTASLWQLGDPVYRVSTGGVFGDQNLSALWYPLTLGVLGALAWAGARRWLTARHSARAALFGWLAAIALLHWLPLLNGYKFVFLLPLPLCILAAPVARERLAGLRGPGLRRRGIAGLLALGLFGGSALQTVDALRSVGDVSAVPTDLVRMVDHLAREPAGNALVPSRLGNMLPAVSSHRVWVGHWFLTPDFFLREQRLQQLTTQPRLAPELRRLLRKQAIRYVVTQHARADFVARQIGAGITERRRLGALELFVLASPGAGADSATEVTRWWAIARAPREAREPTRRASPAGPGTDEAG